jgi:hypothetical protein
MTDSSDLKRALDEVSASSAGGAPFLLAYGATFLITGFLSFLVAVQIAALIALFQGMIALPIAFWLERRMGTRRMSQDNPLRRLSALMAVSQGLAIPALIVVYSLNALYVPVVLAGVGGMHFMPYAWLHRTRLYLYLAAAVALGAFGIQLALRAQAFAFILLFVGLVYWIATPFVYRDAKKLTQEASS